MTKKSMIIALIFVIIAGAIAGAFVFLGKLNDSAVLPGTMHSAGQTGMAVHSLQAEGIGISMQKPDFSILI
jgi:hypothetical protein